LGGDLAICPTAQKTSCVQNINRRREGDFLVPLFSSSFYLKRNLFYFALEKNNEQCLKKLSMEQETFFFNLQQ